MKQIVFAFLFALLVPAAGFSQYRAALQLQASDDGMLHVHNPWITTQFQAIFSDGHECYGWIGTGETFECPAYGAVWAAITDNVEAWSLVGEARYDARPLDTAANFTASYGESLGLAFGNPYLVESSIQLQVFRWTPLGYSYSGEIYFSLGPLSYWSGFPVEELLAGDWSTGYRIAISSNYPIGILGATCSSGGCSPQ